MNIRAAEAIVSSAPKPMKIFPIKEVSSQGEFALLLAITGAVAATGGSAEAIAAVAGAVSCRARSTSLSWSAATTWVSPAT